ncbi:hypothetical protein F4677DRAFT_361692 [Hypoxylon crocopeplum]|nr:hypothetical protein F4677DRAFT_361692 [Hypoxylon crocopeplum]
MAEKQQTEGIVESHVQTTSPVQAASQPVVARNGNEQDDLIISSPPQAAHLVHEGYSSPPNAVKGNNAPQYAQAPGPQRATPLHMLTAQPTWIDCPSCGRRTLTKTTTEGTSMQAVTGVLLCLFCVCLACLPCMCGWFENVHVYCSSCNFKVATILHDGPVVTYGQPQQQQYPQQQQPQQPPAYSASAPGK